MKSGNKILLRALAMWMAAMLMLTAIPCAAMAESFSAMVKSKSMVVSADAKGKSILGKLSKNTVVTVLAYSDGVAKIKYKGHTGYAKVSDMVAVESVAEPAVAKVNTYAYKKPDAKSSKTKIKKGTVVNILATKGNVVMVEKGGAVAYMYRKHLLTERQVEAGDYGEPEDQKTSSKVPSFKDAYTSGKYSNEQLCFLFLTQVMGYNTAAAAGVLANINYESGFKTAINGDGGTSYGICQWHASRKTRLLNYCKEHDVSVDSLAAQLAYLKYELENYYPAVHHYLKSVGNTAQGAYDAGYYFCYNFEAPASRTGQSVKRANSAQNTYFGRYASI